METRVNISKTLPAAWKAMYALELVLQDSPLTAIQKELIKIRTSQINKCAFCLDMHTKDALKYGETAHRIFMLSAWEETGVFTAEEKAILALTEHVTHISHGGVPDSVYEKLKEFFDDNTIASLIMAIVTINGWNRIAISTKLEA